MKEKILKTFLLIVLVLSLFAVVGFFILGNLSKSGKAPGVISGHLSACPSKPNCVSSERADDDSHFISPLPYPASMEKEPMVMIKGVIQEIGGEIRAEEGTYISATFRSTLFRFVDDLECRIDGVNHIIHLRSASRVGHSDFGANRKRVAIISSLFHERVKRAMSPVQAKYPSNS